MRFFILFASIHSVFSMSQVRHFPSWSDLSDDVIVYILAFLSFSSISEICTTSKDIQRCCLAISCHTSFFCIKIKQCDIRGLLFWLNTCNSINAITIDLRNRGANTPRITDSVIERFRTANFSNLHCLVLRGCHHISNKAFIVIAGCCSSLKTLGNGNIHD
jgi:hypothetical protein